MASANVDGRARHVLHHRHIAPLLAERDVVLSAAQVYRLVAQTPERLSLRTLVALCDILDCRRSRNSPVAGVLVFRTYAAAATQARA